MNIAVPINDFNINNVFFQDSIKNTIMDNSQFARVVYSTDFFIGNGIFIDFNIPVLNIDKSFNKYKCIFDNQVNYNLIQTITKIENELMSKCNIKDKIPMYRISEQLKNGYIKVAIINNITIGTYLQNIKFIIKISGIWSNELEYGLTYKFIQV
jgi:translation elongation factor EF-G